MLEVVRECDSGELGRRDGKRKVVCICMARTAPKGGRSLP